MVVVPVNMRMAIATKENLETVKQLEEEYTFLQMAIATRVLSGMGSSTVAGCGNLPMAIGMKES